jgi:hypothetical protein
VIDVTTRNRRNRARGKSTSAELAKYLGGQNVEGMLWPHDVQGQGYRIQSKRDMTGRSPGMVRRLIEAIEPGHGLRAAYLVVPRVRLTSGRVYVDLEEWVAWHGWELPASTRLLNAGTPLLELPLPLFRDIHVNTTGWLHPTDPEYPFEEVQR